MSPRAKPAVPAEAPTLGFRAPVELLGTYRFVAVPARVSRAFAPWAVAARIAVTGTLNATPFQATLLPIGGGRHQILLPASARRGLGLADGATASLSLSPVAPGKVILPPDVDAALDADAAARAAFDAYTPSHRKQLLRVIASAATPTARARAIARTIDHVLGRPSAPGRTAAPRARRTCPACGGDDSPEHECDPGDLDAAFDGTPAPLMALVTRLRAMVDDCGPVAAVALPRGMVFAAERRFLYVTPRRAWLELGLCLPKRIEHPRVRRIDTVTLDRHVHRVRLASPADLDATLADWVWQAYQLGGG
ncbi:MAG: YdeI/OmpD-associated family protein [Deltaproteobacteria bacterium]|nr:YdeI/OmpD-associated family protein [Myxococcales bacterium]MDP3214464.1 YdeI/OmpD-associated family protein [Deltaproteobacteria bacterium]